MGNVPFLDFTAILLSYSIEELMDMTGLPFKKDGKSYRCECPVHKGGKRSLVVTPDQPDEKGNAGVFYCFGEKVGGDRVGLLAHVRQSKPYAVFKELAEKRPAGQKPDQPKGMSNNNFSAEENKAPEEKETGSSMERGFRELPYLEPAHPTVEALGFPPEIAQSLGLGYAPRGHHKGRLALPLRLADGRLIGYISLGSDVLLPPKWHL